MLIDNLVRSIQRAYPQIWFACHVVHRKRGPWVQLTDREAGVLAHIDATPGARATDLAAHLGLSPSTLSAQIQRLSVLGLVEVRVGVSRRERHIRLTTAGERAVSSLSPLEGSRVARLLEALGPRERAAAVAGVDLLAGAARAVGSRTALDRRRESRERMSQNGRKG